MPPSKNQKRPKPKPQKKRPSATKRSKKPRRRPRKLKRRLKRLPARQTKPRILLKLQSLPKPKHPAKQEPQPLLPKNLHPKRLPLPKAQSPRPPLLQPKDRRETRATRVNLLQRQLRRLLIQLLSFQTHPLLKETLPPETWAQASIKHWKTPQPRKRDPIP